MAHKSSTASFLLLTCFAAAAALLLATASSAHALICRPQSECCPDSKPCPSGSECAICDLSTIPMCFCVPTETVSQLRKLDPKLEQKQQPQQKLSLLPASSPALLATAHALICKPHSECCPGYKRCPSGSVCAICTRDRFPSCFCTATESISQLRKLEQQQQLSLLPPALRLLSSSSSSNKLGGIDCFPNSPCCPGKWECADKTKLCGVCTKSIPAYCPCSTLPAADEEVVLLPPGALTGKEGGVTEEEDAKVPLLKLVTG